MEESLNICSVIKDKFAIANQDIRTISPLTLAYIGDSIYDLVIFTLFT